MGILWDLFCRMRKCREKKKDETKYLPGVSVRVVSASEAMEELLAGYSETKHSRVSASTAPRNGGRIFGIWMIHVNSGKDTAKK